MLKWSLSAICISKLKRLKKPYLPSSMKNQVTDTLMFSNVCELKIEKSLVAYILDLLLLFIVESMSKIRLYGMENSSKSRQNHSMW